MLLDRQPTLVIQLSERDHCWNLDYPLHANIRYILDSYRNLSSLHILESIYIRIHSPD